MLIKLQTHDTLVTFEPHSAASMWISNKRFMLSFIICLLCLITTKADQPSNKNISGFYVFGDSTVDPGNNNYINTLFKSNFPPYGNDFTNQVPTGRFCNGKLATDYIASYVGLKKEVLPPYLDPNLSNIEELMTGVSFASAGSGFDPITPSISNVIPIPKQLEYLRECKKRVEDAVGQERAENHMKKAVYFISAGTNDFVLNYFTLPIRRRTYTPLAYQQFLIQNVKQFVQGLLAEGAKKIAIAGVPPMGCLPIMITMNSPNGIVQRDCIDKYSSVARDYNMLLQHEVHQMQLQINLSDPDVKIYYIDIYGPIADMIQAHQRFGFDEIHSGCCGSGYIEASMLCNKISDVCPDPSKYIFWDSIHPTEKAYHNIFLTSQSTIDRILNN